MITIEQFAGLVGRTWPQVITSVNVMAGFKYTLLIQESYR